MEYNLQSIVTPGGNVECVSELGCQIASNRKLDNEVEKRVVPASTAFSALCNAVFWDGTLSITTKRLVYQACVLSVLLYGGKCWIPCKRHLICLDCFHHRCIY